MSTLLLLLFSVLLSALFSGVEIAFLSANRLRLEMERKSGSLSQRILSIYVEHPTQFIASLLVGNNVALVLYGMAMSEFLDPFIALVTQSETYQLVSQTVISTFIILILAEFLPKALFRTHPTAFLTFFAIPIFLFYILFYPVAKGTTLLSQGLLHLLFRRQAREHPLNPTLDLQDLTHLVDEAAQNAEASTVEPIDQEVKIFQNALEFSDLKVRDCLVPRTDIEALPLESTIAQLKDLLITSSFSRIPIFEGSIDNIVGYVNGKSLFDKPTNITEILRPLSFVPETMQARELLAQFMRSKTSMAIVVDEYGGTAGLITIEDLVEEIFGEIDDEHDTQNVVMRKLPNNEYLLSGRAEVDVVNEMFGLDIPDSDNYDTIAGFILDKYPSIPQARDAIQIDRFAIRILQVDGSRIALISLSLLDA